MKVIVLGGGVAGMSAAHELAERDFDVVVYETRGIPGGKARSMPVPGSGTGGRQDLPAEHGFRFFPGFYRHLPDTMRRIPFGGESEGVLGNLVATSRVQMALEGREEIVTPAHFPAAPDDLELAFRSLLAHAATLGIPPQDQAYFVNRLLVLLTSCDQRRFAEYEHQSWWEFSGAETRSAAYGKFLADGLDPHPRGRQGSRDERPHGGHDPAPAAVRPLPPRSARWTGCSTGRPTRSGSIPGWPTCARLASTTAASIRSRRSTRSDARVTGVSIVAQGRPFVDTADFYVAAVPVEVMRLLAGDEMKQAEPRLAGLHLLRTRWMNGIMFYLDRDVSLVHGHSLYIDSPWALTSISQAQFWRDGADLERRGDGRVAGILSVDVSDWEAKGIVHGKQAMFCSKEEVRDEVWAQLKGSLNDAGIDLLGRCERARLVPRPGHRLPESDRGDEPRASADQHRRAPGSTGRRRRPRSRTSFWPRTTFEPTPTWPRWRAPTRPRGGR